MTRMNDLIEVLLDKSSSLSERDDAAMDLSEFDDALDILIKVASDASEAEIIQEICATSIATIWKRCGVYEEDIVNALPMAAASEIKAAFS